EARGRGAGGAPGRLRGQQCSTALLGHPPAGRGKGCRLSLPPRHISGSKRPARAGAHLHELPCRPTRPASPRQRGACPFCSPAGLSEEKRKRAENKVIV